MAGRIATNYPGVYYREVRRLGAKGTEKVYYLVFKKDGKVFEEKVGRQYADDMTPARAATIRGERIEGKRSSRKEIREAKKAAQKAESSRWTIDKLWEHYRTGKGEYPSLKGDWAAYRYIAPLLSHKEPREILPLDVDRLRYGMVKKGKAPQTIKLVLALLKRLILHGEKKGLCGGPAFRIELPKVNNLKTEDLTPEQLGKLLEVLDREENLEAADLIRLVLCTGMRRGECFKLRWEDIDWERGFIHLRDPKGKVDQKVPLNDAARMVLESHTRTESPYVFPGQGGRQRAAIERPVNRIKKAAGLPKDFRPLHGLRHTFASMLASSGEVDLYTLQKLLTHKSPQMTQRYAHLRDETLKRASNLAGNLITDAMKARKAEAEEQTA